MLETNSKFIDRLRNDKIAAPTVRRFTKEGWKKDFDALAVNTEEERAVYGAGVWISDTLKTLWDGIGELDLQAYSFDALVTRIMAITFAETHRHTSGDAPGKRKRLTSDHGTTALGDALWRALSFLHTDKANLTGTNAVTDEIAHELLQSCGTIYVLEFFMGRVIHCGWTLSFDESGPIFGPAPDVAKFARNEAIAHEIRAEDYLEFYYIYRGLWDDGKLRDEAPQHLRLVTRTPTRATFRVVNNPPKTMPETIPLFDMDIPRWLFPLLAVVPNEMKPLPVQQIIGAWLLMHDVFKILYERDARAGADAQISCVLHRDDLLAVFHQLQYPRSAAEQILAFYTYDWSRHESLWAAPLVVVGDLIYPFLPAILYPNMSRSVDLWLKRLTFSTPNGKLDTLVRKRGTMFEGHVRSTLAKEVSKLEAVDARVLADAVTLGSHEIDLLFRVGKTVYVGDAKFLKFPANPNEIGNYYRELEHGAKQVLARCDALDKMRQEVATLLGWSGDQAELNFSSLVVTGHPYGAGLVLHGVPCLSLDMLEMAFREDRYVMSGFDGSVEGAEQMFLDFDRSGSGFEGFLARYVLHPAATWFRSRAVHSIPVTSCAIPPDIEIRFVHYYVDMPRTKEREAYCRPLVAEWEKLMLTADDNARGGEP